MSNSLIEERDFYNRILNLVGDEKESIAIYQNNYLYGHLSVLMSNFPTVLTLLGEDNFKYFAFEYMKESTTNDVDINIFGADFPNFLKTRASQHEIPFIADIAKLDYSWELKKVSKGKVPKGIIELWSKLINNEELVNIEIIEDEFEEYEIINDGEYELKRKK